MAVYRTPPMCPECGKEINGVYLTGFLVGDRFIKWDYEGHVCESPVPNGALKKAKNRHDPLLNQAYKDVAKELKAEADKEYHALVIAAHNSIADQMGLTNQCLIWYLAGCKFGAKWKENRGK